MPTEHARINCSSAKRWINCPGSVQIAERFPQTTSIYADEGTLAHTQAEEALNGKYTFEASDRVCRFYEEHPGLGGSLEEMRQTLKPYIDYVLEEFEAQKQEDPAAELMTEQRVDLSDYIPDGFGTADVVIVRSGYLHIIDLKYGKGVPVFAEGNPQLRLYALGTLAMLDMLYDIQTVVMTIYQPRLDNVSTDTVSASELYTWGDEVIKPAVSKILSADPPMSAGSWCQFCPAKGTCRARSDHYMSMNQMVDRALLSNDELSFVLSQVDDMVRWATDVKDATLAKILDGEHVEGWKAVEGRSIRKFCGSEDEIVAAAGAAGYDKALLYETKMLGLSAIEKIMGKKDFAAALGQYVEKPEGRPALAPDSDKRPALVKDRNAEAAEEFAK